MLPAKYTKIDGLIRPNHQCLTAADNCFFLGEYTSGAGYGTPTNDLIRNFKIRPSEPSSVILVDDVITDGKHFRVCKELILHRYGDMTVFGFFIARRIWERVTLDFDDLNSEF